MSDLRLIFREVDVCRDGAVCVAFRADAQACGDGDADRFFAEAGPDGGGYLVALAAFSRDLPGSCVHAWLGDAIVGQVEVMRDRSDAAAGKVNLLYLRREYRRRGLGAQLERYAVDHLRGAGFGRAWLRVSTGNAGAVAFYKAHGWADVGGDARDPKLRIMEKPLM